MKLFEERHVLLILRSPEANASGKKKRLTKPKRKITTLIVNRKGKDKVKNEIIRMKKMSQRLAKSLSGSRGY